MKYDQIWCFLADATIKLQTEEIEQLKIKNKKLKEEVHLKEHDLKSDRAFRKLENNYKWVSMLLDDLGAKYNALKEKNDVLQDKLQKLYIGAGEASLLSYECRKWKGKYIDLKRRLQTLIYIDETTYEEDFHEEEISDDE